MLLLDKEASVCFLKYDNCIYGYYFLDDNLSDDDITRLIHLPVQLLNPTKV